MTIVRDTLRLGDAVYVEKFSGANAVSKVTDIEYAPLTDSYNVQLDGVTLCPESDCTLLCRSTSTNIDEIIQEARSLLQKGNSDGNYCNTAGNA